MMINAALLLLFFSGLNEGKRVTFQEDLESKSSISSTSSSSSSFSSSSSSDDSSIKHLRDNFLSDGKFGNAVVDDDLLPLRNTNHHRDSRRSKDKKKLRKKSPIKRPCGTVGLLYSSGWEEEMESKRVMISMAEKNGFSVEGEKRSGGIVTDPIDAGWWLISFEGGHYSGTSFRFSASESFQVTLVDLFCRGDSFGVLTGEGKLVAQSSRIQPDRECSERIVCPDEALKDGRWSSVRFDLPEGSHELKVKTIDNPMNGGMAAIKFESFKTRRRRVSRNSVCRGYNGLVVVTESFPRDQAESVCASLKMDLASVPVEAESTATDKTVNVCLKGEERKTVWAAGRSGEIVSFSAEKKGKSSEKTSLALHPILCVVRPDKQQ